MGDRTTILIVEDSDEDFYTTKRAFQRLNVPGKIHRCSDGEEALNFLERKAKYTDLKDTLLPSIILLDLNLPKMSGKELLVKIKSNQELHEIPIIILTTSSDNKDIEACYKAGASSYIQKPVDMNQFIIAMQTLKNYWFDIVLLPEVNN